MSRQQGQSNPYFWPLLAILALPIAVLFIPASFLEVGLDQLITEQRTMLGGLWDSHVSLMVLSSPEDIDAVRELFAPVYAEIAKIPHKGFQGIREFVDGRYVAAILLLSTIKLLGLRAAMAVAFGLPALAASYAITRLSCMISDHGFTSELLSDRLIKRNLVKALLWIVVLCWLTPLAGCSVPFAAFSTVTALWMALRAAQLVRDRWHTA